MRCGVDESSNWTVGIGKDFINGFVGMSLLSENVSVKINAVSEDIDHFVFDRNIDACGGFDDRQNERNGNLGVADTYVKLDRVMQYIFSFSDKLMNMINGGDGGSVALDDYGDYLSKLIASYSFTENNGAAVLVFERADLEI